MEKLKEDHCGWYENDHEPLRRCKIWIHDQLPQKSKEIELYLGEILQIVPYSLFHPSILSEFLGEKHMISKPRYFDMENEVDDCEDVYKDIVI